MFCDPTVCFLSDSSVLNACTLILGGLDNGEPVVYRRGGIVLVAFDLCSVGVCLRIEMILIVLLLL